MINDAEAEVEHQAHEDGWNHGCGGPDGQSQQHNQSGRQQHREQWQDKQIDR